MSEHVASLPPRRRRAARLAGLSAAASLAAAAIFIAFGGETGAPLAAAALAGSAFHAQRALALGRIHDSRTEGA